MKYNYYMNLAIEEAKKAQGKTNPNPLVGAIILKDGKIISKGCHKGIGLPHAEVDALSSAKESVKGGTLFVNLEPCCHYGKTPPCTEAIVSAGIKKVVVGSLDPNPLVAGKGVEILRKNKIEVVTGIMEKESKKLNEIFFKYIVEKEPFVILKYAMTLDGKIATRTGTSKWITNEKSREHAHRLRNRCMGVMVGIGTVLTDNPLLTCRIADGKNPIRIILDSQLRIPLKSKIVTTAKTVPTIIVAVHEDKFCPNNNVSTLREKAEKLEAYGARIVFLDPIEPNISENNQPSLSLGRINLKTLMKVLGKPPYNIDSILLEGGSEVNYSALQASIADKVFCYISPKIFGGEGAKSPIGGLGVSSPEEAYTVENISLKHFQEDILMEGDINYHVHRNN